MYPGERVGTAEDLLVKCADITNHVVHEGHAEGDSRGTLRSLRGVFLALDGPPLAFSYRLTDAANLRSCVNIAGRRWDRSAMNASTSSRRKRSSLPILKEGIRGSLAVAWSWTQSTETSSQDATSRGVISFSMEVGFESMPTYRPVTPKPKTSRKTLAGTLIAAITQRELGRGSLLSD